jgi:hypothetical protein
MLMVGIPSSQDCIGGSLVFLKTKLDKCKSALKIKPTETNNKQVERLDTLGIYAVLYCTR